MTAFLRHLIQRTVNPASGLQPRTPSRFETGMTPATTGFTTERTETAARPMNPARSTAALPVSVPDLAPLHSRPSVPVFYLQNEASRLLSPVPPAPPSPMAGPVTPIYASEPLGKSFNSLPSPPVSPVPADHRPTGIATTAAISPLLPLAPTLLTHRVIEHTHETRTETIRQETRPASQHPATAPAFFSPPSVLAAPAAPPVQPGLNAFPAPAPSIHVTIGRIDVRAVQPSPARHPAPRVSDVPNGPRTSLEDYLKQRSAS